MKTLKLLMAVYLVVASAFTVTILLERHPALDHAVHVAGAGLRDYVLRPGWHLAMEGAGHVYASMTGGGAPAHYSVHQSAHQSALAAIPTPKPAPRVTLDTAPPKAPELARVEQRLKDRLTGALYTHFDLFLYVSKAAHGPVAQRMYVFARKAPGSFKLLHAWPVSTGRERIEFNKAGLKLPSNTPAGYYELDPKRMYVHYRSSQWGEPMPYAMFFNWEKGGYQTGLAIHAAHGKDIARLGRRASEGCIHLSPKDARTLFHLIRTHYKGAVPRFAYDHRTKTISNRGFLMRGPKGALRFYKGYKVLVFIENFSGGKDMVAALM
jgi:hypothetical protein